MPHETDAVAGLNLKMRFRNAECFGAPGQSQSFLSDQRLSFTARFAKARAIKPDIQAAAIFGINDQDLSSDFLD
jgi:hypothetical protein